MSVAGVQWLTAREIAERLGRSKRRVLQWTSDGCPHMAGERDGRECQLYDLDQVRAWLSDKGLEVPEAEPEAGAPVEARSADREVPVDAQEWATISAQLWQTLSGLMGKASNIGERDPAGAQKLMVSIKHTLGELRAIEELRYKQSEREGKLIERSKAREILESQAGMFVSDLSSLEIDIPRKILESLGDNRGEWPEGTGLLRVLGQISRRMIDELRERRASLIEKAISEIDSEAAA
jgi:hypothetical protein